MEWGILGLQALHPDFQALPLCGRGKGTEGECVVGVGGGDFSEDLMLSLRSQTWTERAGLSLWFWRLGREIIRRDYLLMSLDPSVHGNGEFPDP